MTISLIIIFDKCIDMFKYTDLILSVASQRNIKSSEFFPK